MDLWEKLRTEKKPVWLYGMGNGADRIIERLERYGIEPEGVFVSDGFVRDKSFHGFKLCSYADAVKKSPDMTVLVAFGTSIPEVIGNIKRIAKERSLYAPYVPVIGEGDFTSAYYAAHKSELDNVRSMLCDEQSKRVFDNIINYRLTGEIDYLLTCESLPEEAYGLLNLRDEVYVDLGAYTGDTVAEFIRYTKGYERIYALEPDKKTFRKLEKNLSGLENTYLYNAAAHEKSGKIAFAMRGGRNSSAAETGILTDSVSVDDILEDNRASYIKMDVEGAELAAIRGAKETILKYKPKLAISCYHRIDDIFEIPKEVLSLRKDYKVYMRHMPYIPDWDTVFYFV